jgi:hypothetical protein
MKVVRSFSGPERRHAGPNHTLQMQRRMSIPVSVMADESNGFSIALGAHHAGGLWCFP